MLPSSYGPGTTEIDPEFSGKTEVDNEYSFSGTVTTSSLQQMDNSMIIIKENKPAGLKNEKDIMRTRYF